MEGYKVFTHNLCSPIQGGEPVWDGTLPFTTPKVEVDTSDAECAAGWNFCQTAEDALSIAGFWPDGWPARLFTVRVPRDVLAIERGQKCRAEQLVITEEVKDIESCICNLSIRWFNDDASMMAKEQVAWLRALGRPTHDEGAMQDGLRAALEARNLVWKIECFDTTRAAWDAWAAWAARATWDAWAAWDALTVFYAFHMGWVDHEPNLLTTGIRDAYANGLAVALPTTQDTLGYAMVERDE